MTHVAKPWAGPAGRRVPKHFTWSRVAAGMYTRYEQLCNQETPSRPNRAITINERISS
jgi:hypothetical protein